MAYISFQPSDYFNTVTYTGTAANDTAITGVGFQPDLTWIKKRSSTSQHVWTDSSRGVTKQVFSSTSDAEQTATDFITSFDTDGFTLDNNSDGTKTGDVNVTNGATYVSWNWLANGGTTSSNTDGSITSTVQANTTAGFSIVTYTGTGSNATVGHGLTSAPKLVIYRNRDYATNWAVYSKEIGAGNRLYLSATDASTASSVSFNSTDPTSSVLSVGTYETTNRSGDNMLAYCFAEIKGYSKFGSYTGNGSTNGTFVYTGFKPAFVMTKRTNAIGPYNIKDTKRPGYNDTDDSLFANSNAAEDTRGFDILSNGFKLRNSGTEMNGGGSTYIYMAFAEHPLVASNGLPATAR